MKALGYINERRVLVGGFMAGAAMFLLVYFLFIPGPATRTVIARASRPTAPHGAAAANAIRHIPGLIHISEGVKGCGSAKSSTGHVVVTKSGNSMCAQGGTMYANLMAMHTPRTVINMMVLQYGPDSINGKVTPEYQTLRGLGVPKQLARKLVPLKARLLAGAVLSQSDYNVGHWKPCRLPSNAFGCT